MFLLNGKTMNLLVLFMAGAISWAQNIDQALGVDQRVTYSDLTKFGPWDDRNYQVALEDLQVLSANEAELMDPIPVFFRIELRREFPHLLKSGPCQYPRAAVPLFHRRYGGLIVDGRIPDKRDLDRGVVPINNEVKMNQLLGANEVTVEINHAFPNRAIGGSNNNGGQEMYYSTDSGATWTIQGTLPNTCCDPTVGWSSDGTIAYSAALSGAIGVSFYRSTDFGVTWGAPIVLTASGSDKEFLHVDISPTSPHQDNVYLTWHNGNTMQFARSLDMGVSFQPTIAFPSAPRGIGSDITTDLMGNLYYFYGAFDEQQIVMLKSTDGGVTFDSPVVVASTNGSFDWPIPAMESRNAWIYVACDADRSSGAFDGSVYTAWTDTHMPETGTAANNHTQIHVAYSRDGGVTWTESFPHDTLDVLEVDRFNQWITVDNNGIVHVAFYDTRHSTGRTGVDYYYSFSNDGGVTWHDPVRVSSETSANLTDGQEWGDYNGLSVFQTQLLGVWTDNREGPPNSKDVYSADIVNIAAEPTFLFSAPIDQLNQTLCAPGSLTNVDLTVGSLLDFMNPVTLSFSSLPSGFTGSFTVNPVTPPNATQIMLSADGTVTAGQYILTVNGTATGTDDKQIDINVLIQTGADGPPTLISPPDGDLNAGIGTVFLNFDPVVGATGYHIQVSDSPAFGTTLFDEVITDNSFAATGMIQGNLYYWRVATINSCAEGAFSGVFSFTANAEFVFLVDQDDNSPDVLSYYVDTLTELAVSYKLHDASAQGKPTLVDMTGHPVVIWFSGDRFSGPDAADGTELGQYLDNGGRLFLSSQDYLYPFRPDVPAFGDNYLGLGTITNDGGDYTSVDPAALGLFDGLGNMPLNYLHTDYSDNVGPNGNGSLDLVGDNLNGAAVVTDKTVFFGFPFTAIANNSSRGANTSQNGTDVMERILSYLAGCDVDLTVDAGPDLFSCSGSINLLATPANQQGTVNYSWQPAGLLNDPMIANPVATVAAETVFTVTITDDRGCPVSDSVLVSPLLIYSPDMLTFWTTNNAASDINGDGQVDITDYTEMVTNSGSCP